MFYLVGSPCQNTQLYKCIGMNHWSQNIMRCFDMASKNNSVLEEDVVLVRVYVHAYNLVIYHCIIMILKDFMD